MTKCILHIGSGKTGTTTLQKTLASHRNILLENGVLYPGDDINHHHLSLLALPASILPRQYKTLAPEQLKKTREEFWRNLSRSLEKEKYHTVILSTEYLFTASEYAVDKIEKLLQGYFNNIEIVASVRDPAEYYVSNCQQTLKANSKPPDPRTFKYHFLKTLKAWKKFKTRVYIYNRNPDFVQRLITAILPKNLYLNPISPENASLTIEQLLLLEKIQKHLYTGKDDIFKPHLELINLIRPTNGSKPILKNSIRSLILKNHYRETIWLNHKLKDQNYLQPNHNRIEVSLPITPTLQDIFVIKDQKSIEKYEMTIMDEALRTIHAIKKRS